ncbi:flavin-dependent dehydrogenase [Paraburkholderia youngii]
MSDKTISLHACDYDVAVIGLGPTGATLANLLAIEGLRVLVLERDKDIFALPRAVHF